MKKLPAFKVGSMPSASAKVVPHKVKSTSVGRFAEGGKVERGSDYGKAGQWVRGDTSSERLKTVANSMNANSANTRAAADDTIRYLGKDNDKSERRLKDWKAGSEADKRMFDAWKQTFDERD